MGEVYIADGVLYFEYEAIYCKLFWVTHSAQQPHEVNELLYS
jgi:hypothetical protein